MSLTRSCSSIRSHCAVADLIEHVPGRAFRQGNSGAYITSPRPFGAPQLSGGGHPQPRNVGLCQTGRDAGTGRPSSATTRPGPSAHSFCVRVISRLPRLTSRQNGSMMEDLRPHSTGIRVDSQNRRQLGSPAVDPPRESVRIPKTAGTSYRKDPRAIDVQTRISCHDIFRHAPDIVAPAGLCRARRGTVPHPPLPRLLGGRGARRRHRTATAPVATGDPRIAGGTCAGCDVGRRTPADSP